MGFIEIIGASGAAYRFKIWPMTGVHPPMAGIYVLTTLSPLKPLRLGLSEDLSQLAASLEPQFEPSQIYTRLIIARQQREAEYADLAAAHPGLCSAP